MIELIRAASTLQFILGCVALVTFVLIVLQSILNRAVWTPYLVAFLGSVVGIAVTLR